ncbi:MAG TPA: hypothetical protein VIL20_19805 [Sandaracinaceae bacterium]
MQRKWAALATTIAALGWRAPAGAQAELTVRTLEHGDWASTIVALQHDPHAEGRTVHVVVGDGSARTPCGRYFLVLDAHGQAAFATGGCDPATQATELRLVDRRALFELGDFVARPRTIQIVAFEVRQAIAQGRAVPPASTELRCTVALRPYLYDLLRGTPVRATPDRFEVRALDGADVSVDGDAWTVRSGSLRFAYELVDRRSGEVVLRETVSLACSSEGAARPVPRRVPPSSERPEIAPDLPIERTLDAASPSRFAGRCGGEQGPDDVLVLHVGEPTWIALRLESRFDAILSLRNEAGRELQCDVVVGAPGDVRVPRTWAQLAPGTYYVVVDAVGRELADGRYRLGMDFARLR